MANLVKNYIGNHPINKAAKNVRKGMKSLPPAPVQRTKRKPKTDPKIIRVK